MLLLNFILIFLILILKPVNWMYYCIFIIVLPIIDFIIFIYPMNKKIVYYYNLSKDVFISIFNIYPINIILFYIKKYNDIIGNKICNFILKSLMNKININNIDEKSIINLIQNLNIDNNKVTKKNKKNKDILNIIKNNINN